MEANGDSQKKCLITEGGWNDNPRWVNAVSPSQRIDYTIRAYDKALNDWPWVEGVALWAFRFPKPNYNYFDGYSFVTPDFTPKAIYLEVQRYARGKLSAPARQDPTR
jgi:polysaccharide biosynthesis protein PslG